MSDPSEGDSLLNMTLGDLLALFRSSNAVGGGTADPERWLDLRDDDFPINPRLAWAAIKSGELEGSRVGNATLVKWRNLDRWLASKSVKPAMLRRAPEHIARVPESIAHLVRTGSDR